MTTEVMTDEQVKEFVSRLLECADAIDGLEEIEIRKATEMFWGMRIDAELVRLYDAHECKVGWSVEKQDLTWKAMR